jgi:hypothetical protein
MDPLHRQSIVELCIVAGMDMLRVNTISQNLVLG